MYGTYVTSASTMSRQKTIGMMSFIIILMVVFPMLAAVKRSSAELASIRHPAISSMMFVFC